MSELTNKAAAGYAHRLQKFLFLDLDGTIRRSKSGKTFIQDVDDVELFPDVLPVLNRYVDEGFMLAGITNQGAVAHGIKTGEQVNAELMRTNELTGELFCSIQAAFSMPDGNIEPYCHKSLSRKPHYGMLVNLEIGAWSDGMIVDWDNSIFVGDRDEDRLCAEAAGVKFVWAYDFFGRNIPKVPDVSETSEILENEAFESLYLNAPTFEGLTYDNFWTKAKEDYPEAVALFCDWIDAWKKKNVWAYSKFHELPLAVQLGILGEFSHQHDGSWMHRASFFLYIGLEKNIELLNIFFTGLEANILKHKINAPV